MALVWPPTLPHVPLVEGFEETEATLTLRSSIDAGPPKVRRRFTAGIGQITCRYTLDRTLLLTLSDFYLGPAAGGAVAFEWFHPRRQVTVMVRFREPVAYRPEAPELWTATVALEVLPPGMAATLEAGRAAARELAATRAGLPPPPAPAA
jgi:hypothetical protein